MTKREELRKWAEDVVPEFNKLSDATKTPYYTQSPLNVIESTIENLVIGINPGSGGHEASILDVDDFFAGVFFVVVFLTGDFFSSSTIDSTTFSSFSTSFSST